MLGDRQERPKVLDDQYDVALHGAGIDVKRRCQRFLISRARRHRLCYAPLPLIGAESAVGAGDLGRVL